MQILEAASPERHVAWAGAAAVALTAPTLLAFNLSPSSTFLNQAASLIGWGVWLTLLGTALTGPRAAWSTGRSGGWGRSGPSGPSGRAGLSGLVALQCALALLGAAALAAAPLTQLPWSLALSHAGLIAAAMLAVQVAAASQHHGLAQPVCRAFCIGLVVAGAASSVVGVVQVFAPQWADGSWIARTYIPGRAVGNLRQPNHLSSLLLWATLAALWLGEARVLRRGAGFALALAFVFVVVLSGSRTGAVSMALLAGWGVLDRRLSRATRGALLLAPVIYAVFWFGLSTWGQLTHEVFGGEKRFSGQGDISSSRFGIWANTLSLIRLHPWLGVGFGEFNFAWTLTPFPGRPVAFFDHTHNLILQLAVELGLPLAASVLGLLGWALTAAWRGAIAARDDADPAQAPLRRAAFMMVLLILVHSLLEYPLWYAYFLLPAAFAFGLCLGVSPAPNDTRDPSEPRDPRDVPARGVTSIAGTRPLVLASLLLVFGGAASVFDYLPVVAIFSPGPGAAPLAERIAEGRRSVFFAHHAHYAAATTPQGEPDPLTPFRSASHYLLDARLMQAWAEALYAAGDVDRARYVAQRLREFGREQSADFFAPCAAVPEAPGATSGTAPALPFQCQAPTRGLTFEDFR